MGENQHRASIHISHILFVGEQKGFFNELIPVQMFTMYIHSKLALPI